VKLLYAANAGFLLSTAISVSNINHQQ